MPPLGGPHPEPDFPADPGPETEQAMEPDDIDPFIHDRDLQYRARKMRRAGLNPRQARALALDREVDSTQVVRALEQGCAPDLCFHIFS